MQRDIDVENKAIRCSLRKQNKPVTDTQLLLITTIEGDVSCTAGIAVRHYLK